MLFAVDVASKVASFVGGSYRVKRVCMDSSIVRSFCAQCPLTTKGKVCFGCFRCCFFACLECDILLLYYIG
jgi:hypothetical protein